MDPQDNTTPRPWRVGDAGHGIFGPPREDRSLPEMVAASPRLNPANARLIVSRVNGWEELEAERDKLRAQVAELRAALGSLYGATTGATEHAARMKAGDVLARTAAEGREQ